MVLLLVVIVVLVEAVMVLRGLRRRGRLVVVLLGVVRVLRVVFCGRCGGGGRVVLVGVVVVRAASGAAPAASSGGIGVVQIRVAEAVVRSDDVALVAHLRRPVIVVVRRLLVAAGRLGVVRRDLVVQVRRRLVELAGPRRRRGLLLGAFVARVLGHHAVHHRALSPWRALTLLTPPRPDVLVVSASAAAAAAVAGRPRDAPRRRLPLRPGPLARETHRS